VRVLIVDDEPLARRGVVLRLRGFPDVEVVGEAGNGAAAVRKILALAPEVVFLDVQMPGMDGFEVLRALPPESLPGVIFLTAYERHALRAFEVHALDYLLKPIDDARFAAAVARARRFGEASSRASLAERVLALLTSSTARSAARFLVQTGARLQVVLAEDVDWIAASGDYVALHAHGRSYLLRETMAALEQRLDPRDFLRIHRSRFVRTQRIQELRAIDNREYIVRLADGSEHRSSRTYAGRLEGWLTAAATTPSPP
jgi:two-component system LytT family response regulator